MRRAKHILLVVTTLICTLLLLSLHPPTAATFVRLRRRIFYGASYQAELHCNEPGDYTVQDSYVVSLHRGYSLDQHKQFLDECFDLDAGIRFVFINYWRSAIEYYADLDDYGLKNVRQDYGVDLVECEGQSVLDDPVENEPEMQ